jgi:diguanylate cyclase (GGDEF)-like protein
MIRNLTLILFSLLLISLFYLNNNYEWFMMNETIGLMHFVALGIVAVSMGLILLFRRSRLFFVLLTFTLFAIFAEWFDYLRHTDPNATLYLHLARSLDFYLLTVVSFFVVILSYFKDRGVITFIGIIRLIVILLLSALFVFLVLHDSIWLDQLKQLVIFPWHYSNVSDIEVISISLLFILLLIKFFISPKNFEPIFFIAFVAIILAALMPKTLDHLIIMLVIFSLLAMLDVISRSYYMAYIDELTELKGRRAMNEALVRLGSNYTVVMGDIDFFKNFNDTYGHDVGDEVLKLVAKQLDKVKDGGEAFRWGGEEFVLLFADKKAADVFDAVEKVRISIEKHPFRIRDKSRPEKKPDPVKPRVVLPQAVTITMSFGMASKSELDKEPSDVMKRADEKLYKAKESGRNCVVM